MNKADSLITFPIKNKRSTTTNKIKREALLRHLSAASMRYDGLTYKQIGEHFKVSENRAWQLVRVGKEAMDKYFDSINKVAEIIHTLER